ncbi:hypothetical protein [Francisella salina]|uniref:Chitin-binding type-3 domain-containing protein n=1 Tax=Francisella salina TaxID=573569 RepID=A0ABM5MBU4_FRAST|nr:hypothetical protein [Francisella salina]AEI36627.1 hypothetical protein F7308_1703 [Francisella salina]
MRRNIKLAKSQQGVALIAAISIATIMLVVSYTLFNISYSNSVLSKNQTEKIHKMSSMQEAFTNSIANSSFDYSENLILPEIAEYRDIESGKYFYETTNSDLNEASLQVKPFILAGDGYTTRALDYYIKLTINNYEKNVNIRVISNKYISQDNVIDRSSISLNIPAVDYHALSQIQLNSNDTLTNADVGYIGDLSINNDNELTFTNTDGSKHYLNLPSNFTGIFNLSQGWLLNNGVWEVSIGVYNINSSQGCIIKSSLDDFIADISALECVPIEEDTDIDYEGARYPNPAGLPICVENDRYRQGDICQEDGILFIANKNNARALPFQRSNDWRVYYPDSDWIAPYTQGARYSDGDLVAYDSIVFRSTQNNQNRNPFRDNDWRVNGIYAWNEQVRYLSGDIVTFNGDFYQAKRTNKGNSDSPTDTRDWTNIGSTLEQSNINQLPQQAQANVSAGTTVNDYQPINIVFPYRDESPSQAQLNCEGEYPPINTNTFSQCIDGQVYNTGDTCYENNMLFTAQYYTTDSPFNRPNAWRLDIPTQADTGLDWVVPYGNNVMYADNVTKVIYDGRRFTNSYWINEGTTPYENDSWIVDGIYGWHEDIQYRVNEVVIRDGNFYRANGWSKNSDPLTNSTNFWDDWENLGSTYNNQTAEEALNSCGASNINNVVVQFNLGDNLFRDRNGNGDYLTTDMQNLPNGFGLYGDSNPTTVSYTLSGSLFDAASLIYVTDENGWVALYNPDAQGETLVRDWGDKNATIFINTDYGNIPSGDYDLTIDLEYSLNGQTYQGSSSYSITI